MTEIEQEVSEAMAADPNYPLGETDAMKWAVAWRLTRDRKGIDANASQAAGDIDGWMVGWFANAMASADPKSVMQRAKVSRDYDYEISDYGVMTATANWRRDDAATTLRLVGCHSIDLPLGTVASWTDDQVKQADIWAWSSALSASDHDDMQVPPKPDFIPDAKPLTRHPITGEQL